MFVLFVFSGKLDCLFCIFAWWIIVFWRFWWGFFFLLLSLFPAGFSNLMEVYRRFIVTKIPKWFLSYFFSARNFLFLECYAALWRFFFLPAQCTWKCFFSSFPELPKTEVQYSKPEMTYMTFLQMNSSAGLRSDSEFI